MKSLLIFILVFCFASNVFSSINDNVAVNPTKSEFYQVLSYNGTGNIIINYSMNKTSWNFNYDYSESKSSNSEKNIEFTFEKDNLNTSNAKTKLTIENLSLSNYGNIIFNLGHKTQILFKDCTFTNNGRIWFYFDNEERLYNSSSFPTNIVFDECTITKNNIDISNTEYFDLMRFERIENPDDSSEEHYIKNITIKNSTLTFDRNDNTTLNPISSAIKFYRINSKTSFSNIAIRNNKIYLNNNYPFYENGICGIEFSGCNSENFRSDDLYNTNTNVDISENEMYTKAIYSKGAMLVEGPVDVVKIDSNVVVGFTRYMLDGDDIYSTPVIELYGSRPDSIGYYSNNIRNAHVGNNIIKTHSTGIRVSGGEHIVIENNDIELLSEPDYTNDFSFWKTER